MEEIVVWLSVRITELCFCFCRFEDVCVCECDVNVKELVRSDCNETLMFGDTFRGRLLCWIIVELGSFYSLKVYSILYILYESFAKYMKTIRMQIVYIENYDG